MVLALCAMEESSCQSRRGFGGGGEDSNGMRETQISSVRGIVETSKAASRELKREFVEDKEQRAPIVQKDLLVECNGRRNENVEIGKRPSEGAHFEVKSSEEEQVGDGYEICGYELRAVPGANAMKRLSVVGVAVKEEEKPQSLGSKVKEEVMKVLFGPPDAKTPDGEKYEVVEEEEVTPGVGHTGVLFRFSMWATFSFVIWVLAGGRAQVGCPELFPNIRERDPVPKVIVRRQSRPS